MKKTIILLLLFYSRLLCAQDISGDWSGQLTLGFNKLLIVFHIQHENSDYSATMDSPNQGVKGIPVSSVQFIHPDFVLKIPNINAEYTGKMINDTLINGTFSQNGLSFELNLTKEERVLIRPQEPQPPYPYISENVTFLNEKTGNSLAGTLTLPQSGSAFAAVILITGSGPQNRNEELMGHKPFLVIADYLTRNGIAVLRYDDRGTGESQGDFSTATTFDFAMDADAAFNYLKTRKEIDTERIGLLGHSEGGIVAFILAAENPEIAFVISLAGAGVRGNALILKQAESLFKSQGMPEEQWNELQPVLRNRYNLLIQDKDREEIKKELYADVLKQDTTNLYQQDENMRKRIDADIEYMTSPWYINFMKYDPGVSLQQIKCPVFAINGEKDVQVDAGINLTAIEDNIRSNGNARVTIKKYPNLNHLFQHCNTCTVMEYGQLEETISTEVLQDIKDWILTGVWKNS